MTTSDWRSLFVGRCSVPCPSLALFPMLYNSLYSLLSTISKSSRGKLSAFTPSAERCFTLAACMRSVSYVARPQQRAALHDSLLTTEQPTGGAD